MCIYVFCIGAHKNKAALDDKNNYNLIATLTKYTMSISIYVVTGANEVPTELSGVIRTIQQST